ncbi:hypothetical protein GCM10027280_29100 [Micromonospora polyrhachis]|uniref:Uncharacterized protein n=1 Tax=Micromonospora polyrhachis TaxID=1282883 RepID=A0A7W7SQJ2_9ACTN|nr:hypothetical protein [Micromonospora polyrhachis]MBB4959109.1 hypothetical protein [Micromonospora polyrhachis]
MRSRRGLLGTALASLTILTSFLLVPSPAQAYGSLTVKWARVDTDNCNRLSGNLPVTSFSNGCMLYDSADDTFFEKDAGGVAVKIELHDGSGLVAKVEFHPLGEKLYVYDTRNDSDTVYTWLRVGGHSYGPWSAPGTSAPVEHRVVDTSIAEGTYLLVDIYDDNGHSDYITSKSGSA